MAEVAVARDVSQIWLNEPLARYGHHGGTASVPTASLLIDAAGIPPHGAIVLR